MTGEIPLFGYYHDEPILPPSKQREKMDVAQLQERYPFRSRLYDEVISDNETIGINPEVLLRRLQMLNNLDRYVTTHGGTGKARVLREKQLAVFKATRDFLEKGGTEGFIEAPTGFGKTVLFSEIIKATDQRTLVVVPSRILVKQTYEALKERNPGLNIGRFYSDKKERDRQVTVTTYQSLVISSGGVDPEDVDLLVLDEVHQSLTDARIGAVGRFINPVKLGFTATPEYTRDKRVENLLNNEIHSITLKEAVEAGLLCSFSVYLAETNVDLSNVKINSDGDYNERELEEAVNIYSRNKSAVELYKKLNAERSGLSKAVAYCVSIKHAIEVARVFNEAGVRAEAVWSDQDPKERDRIIEAYKRGEIKILTNVNVLTEGFDDPQAALCLNLRPTLSRVVAKQRGGRVLRLDPENIRKHAIIVDYMDRNENKRSAQVTFAQVAEGAQIINPITIDGNGIDKGSNDNDKEDKVLVDKTLFDLEGLRVITNSEEVLRIVRELEAEVGGCIDIADLTENDFPLIQRSFRDAFIGSTDKWKVAAEVILERIRTENPSLCVTGKSGVQSFDVIRDRKRFIAEMLAAGIFLRGEDLPQVSPKDFVLGTRVLKKVFRGSVTEVLVLAKEVVGELVEQDSSIITQKRAGNLPVIVITKPEVFKQEMVKRGAQLLPPRVSDSDFVISYTSVRNTFVGDAVKLVKVADEVSRELESEDATIIANKLLGRGHVRVVTDRSKFIDAMKKRGMLLKSDLEGNTQDDSFPVAVATLSALFSGNISDLLREAKSIAALHKDNFGANLVKGRSVLVCSDREFLIHKLKEKGFRLKALVTPPQPTDSPIRKDLEIIFVGCENRLDRCAKLVIERIRSENPALIVKRLSGKRPIDVCIKRELFVSYMLEAGVKLRN